MKKPSDGERIAYQGPAFTIEWYWDAHGRSPPLEYFEGLPENRQDDLLILLKRMGDLGRIFDKTRFRQRRRSNLRLQTSPGPVLVLLYSRAEDHHH